MDFLTSKPDIHIFSPPPKMNHFSPETVQVWPEMGNVSGQKPVISLKTEFLNTSVFCRFARNLNKSGTSQG